MKNLNFFKASSLLMVVLVMATFVFTSTNTTDTSNEQIIAELSEKVATMDKALEEFKAAEELVVGEPFIGEVSLFAGNFAPRGYAFCNGQLLSINNHSALFSLLGCEYGGDCRSNFALPDLRGRVVAHSGDSSTGPGLKPIKWAEKGGLEENRVSKVQVSTSGDNKVEVINQIDQNNRQPYLGLNYIIALEGSFPSRN